MEKQLIPDYIFEVSWEVCNKVGGIYTVLSTKARTLQKLYKDRIIFIGPDIWGDKPCPYFIRSKTLLKDWHKQASLPQNMKVKIGRWDIPGRPIVILVDFKSLYPYKNDLYGEMWNRYGVNSLPAYGDYDESCISPMRRLWLSKVFTSSYRVKNLRSSPISTNGPQVWDYFT